MEFGLLGLFEVREDGRAVDLPRGKERALLAALLLRANEPVSTDQLIDELWADRPPENATKTVQIYVSRLRKSVGAERLRTTPAGYVVRVERGELDRDEFERLAAEGREQLSGGDATAAERSLSRALALWRGPALADFRFDSFAQAEVRRLEELRDQASADRIDSQHAQGRAGETIAELEVLTARNPLWERPRRQLMLALYRAGRQADALELYRKTRELLDEELGIEPGPELQALERSILKQDEALAGVAPQLSMTRRAVARRGGRPMLVGGFLILAAAAAAAVLLATRGAGGIAALAPGTIGVVDAASMRISRQLPSTGQPTRLAVGSGGDVWVGDDEADTLSAVDPGARAVRRVAATRGFPSDVAVGEGGVWVVDGESGMLTRFDPTYGSSTQHARVAPRNPISYDRSRESLDPTSVAVGLGSVWTTDGSTSLVRTSLDLKRVKYINLGSPLDDVAVGDGAVWALSGPAAKVYRLDRDGHVTVPIPIAPKPGLESPYPIAIAVGAGAVWVLNDNTATVTKIDPAQNLVLATKRLGIQRRPVRIAVGDGAAWVADADGTLARIDATTDQEPQFLPAAGSLRDVAVVGTTVWVTAGPGAGDLAAKSVSASSAPLHALPESFCSPFYSQSGTRPRYLIVGELALQGLGGRFIAQTGEAIQFVLKQHHYRAGGYALGYQSCDSSSAAAGYPTPAKCAADAHAYAADPSVLAVIGAWSSLCTQAELPIANSAPGASLAMISYSNTYIGLTHHGPGTASNEPAKYYPTGTRSYARVIAADDQQGAADAVAARTLGARRVYVLHDTNPYGSGIAADFAAAARRLGLTVIGPALWKFTNVSRFAARVTRSHPDAVFLGTDSSHPENVRLIKDLRSALPRSTLLMAPDGFDANDLVAKAGSAAEGMTVSAVGVSAERLPAAGRRFVNGFEQATGSTAPSTSSIAAAQATEVLLTAIAHSNGTRASVVKELLRTHVSNGILGSFGFDRNGDTTAGAVTIYKIVKGVPRVFRVITPPRNLAR